MGVLGAGVGWLACSQNNSANAGGGSGKGGGVQGTGENTRLTMPQQRQTAKYLGMKEVKGLKSQGTTCV